MILSTHSSATIWVTFFMDAAPCNLLAMYPRQEIIFCTEFRTTTNPNIPIFLKWRQQVSSECLYLCETEIDQPVQWFLCGPHNAESITNFADSFSSCPKTGPEPVTTHVLNWLGVSWFQAYAELLLIYLLFCSAKHRWFVCSCRRFGTIHRPLLQGSCSPRRTSATNYQSTLPNTTEDRYRLLVVPSPRIKRPERKSDH